MKNNSVLDDDIFFLDDDSSSDIQTVCLSCGFSEKVPDFIYEEMGKNKFHFKIKRKVTTITCQKCFKDTAVSSYWLNQ